MKYNPKFTIIIPTYNEENDIEDTIKSLLVLNYNNFDILIIDDSIDSTPDIIKRYENQNVRLIKPKIRQGRCEARNIGIKEATGEILLILNADVHLPVDFINRILPYYEKGADYVMVDSSVENIDDLFARYIDCAHKYRVNETNWVDTWKWTEGFSLRKEVALKTSLFPSGHIVPIVAGEDARFGTELEEIGAKKIVDLDIVVTHIAPASFEEYWYIRKGRGSGTPQIRRFLDKWSYSKIKNREYLKLIRFILSTVTILPMLYKNFKLTKYSSKNRIIDTFRFSYAWVLEQAAFSVGAFEALNKIIEKESKI